jgi:2-hydroxy-6-oxonona-2,4-dienedioate hydrolase
MDSPKIRRRSVSLLNCKIHFREAGNGAPLVLIHGFGHSSTAWLRTFGVFAGEHRTIAPDLPDFNRSTGPNGASSPMYFAKVLTEFVERLKLRRVHLVGSSLGGLVALIAALERPNLFGKLILANPAGFTRPPIPPLDEAVLAFLTFWLSLPRTRPLARAAYERAFYDKTRADDETVDEFMKRAQLPDPAAQHRSRILHDLFRFSRQLDAFHPRLFALAVPTLVVWGKNDPLLPSKDAEIAKRVLPGPRIELLDRCGHLPQIEHPEAFSSLVLDFLNAA